MTPIVNTTFIGKHEEQSLHSVLFSLNWEKLWVAKPVHAHQPENVKSLVAEFNARLFQDAPLEDLLNQWQQYSDNHEDLNKSFKVSQIVPLEFPVGTFCPRIMRPICEEDLWRADQYSSGAHKLSLNASYASEIQKVSNALNSLQSQIHELFEYIAAEGDNLSATGSRIAQIAINLCVIFENQCSQILKENGVTKDRFTTKDFVRLLPVLRLSDYCFYSTRYPWLEEVSPFQNWTKDAPTQSIEWFRRYNIAKHDGFNSSENPRAIDVLSAFASCLALVHAQVSARDANRSPFRGIDVLQTKQRPRWKLENSYFFPLEANELSPVGYFQNPEQTGE